MVYREPAATEETLESYDVSTTKGGGAVGALLGGALIFVVAGVVGFLGGAPPEIDPWLWTFPTGALLFAAPALWLWRKRKRTLHLVRLGARIRLVVPGAVELEFPLSVSGRQLVMPIRGVSVHHVYLKLVGASGGAIFLQEVRGAIHGGMEAWPDAIDRTTPALSYDVGHLGDIARIKARVEALNHETAALGRSL